MGADKSKLMLAGLIAGGAYLAARTALQYARRYDFKDRLVVITGGSRGLGLLMARELAHEGAALVICARDEEELTVAVDDLADRATFVAGYLCDLSKPIEIRSLFERIRREVGSIDVLINNAGIIQVGPLETMTIEDYHQAMLTHFWAPLLCIEQVLPEMRRRSEGRIVNISSIGGEIGVPHLAPYCASKFALNGLSQTARAELAKHGIFVTTVCPGLLRTGSHFNALFKGKHRQEFAWFSIGNAIPGLSMSAERAARKIIDACRYGRAKLTLTLPAKAAVAASSVMPEITAEATAFADWLLPRSGGIGRQALEGSQSTSSWAPSFLTSLSDQAAIDNNELSST